MMNEDTKAPAIHDGYAIASLVLSLVWLGGLGSVMACIFGGMSETQAKRAHRKASAMALAGQVFGVLGVIGVLALLAHGH
jgi:hypothetical protein